MMKDVTVELTMTKDTVSMSLKDWKKFIKKLRLENHYTITEEATNVPK